MNFTNNKKHSFIFVICRATFKITLSISLCQSQTNKRVSLHYWPPFWSTHFQDWCHSGLVYCSGQTRDPCSLLCKWNWRVLGNRHSWFGRVFLRCNLLENNRRVLVQYRSEWATLRNRSRAKCSDAGSECEEWKPFFKKKKLWNCLQYTISIIYLSYFSLF